jgi:tetratricopeptide (TPR) repeat protein
MAANLDRANAADQRKGGNMKFKGSMTAAVLVAALAAVGCSKSDERSNTMAQSPESALIKPVSMTSEPSVTLPTNRGLDETAKISGPVSFGDGETAYQAGNYSEATKIFEQYTVQKPENAWGHYMLGLSAWKGGDPAKAEKAFDEALRIDPKHVKSLVNLSRVLIEQKRFDDAIGKLTHASDIDPKSAEVTRLLGRTYDGQGKVDDAVAAYRHAIALDGKDAWSMNNLGLLFLEQGRPNDAIPPLARAVELRKDVPVFHNNLGMALEHTGRFQAAAAEYKDALAANPGYEKAQQNLTRVEAVKVNAEEPFDLEGTAKRFADEIQIPVDEATAGL